MLSDLHCDNIFNESGTVTGQDCYISTSSPYYASGTPVYYTGLNKSEMLFVSCVIILMFSFAFYKFIMSSTTSNEI